MDNDKLLGAVQKIYDDAKASILKESTDINDRRHIELTLIHCLLKHYCKQYGHSVVLNWDQITLDDNIVTDKVFITYPEHLELQEIILNNEL